MVAAGGGDGGLPGHFQDADGEGRVAMTWGLLPVRAREASSP